MRAHACIQLPGALVGLSVCVLFALSLAGTVLIPPLAGLAPLSFSLFFLIFPVFVMIFFLFVKVKVGDLCCQVAALGGVSLALSYCNKISGSRSRHHSLTFTF